MEDEPLDIPHDLVELAPGSSEAKNAHRKYIERWIQPGDHIYVLGTASADSSTTAMKISKAGKSSPLFVSKDAQDLTAKAFQRAISWSCLLWAWVWGCWALFLFLSAWG